MILLRSRWEELNADKPEVLKKTKCYKQKVNLDGKIVTREMTKAYKDPEGEWDFEEVQGKQVRKSETVDSGAFQVVEDQVSF